MALQQRTARAVSILVIVAMLGSVVLASFVSFYASSAPDGLQKVAQENGFADREEASATADSPLAGYEFSGVQDDRFSVALAGLIGVGITAVVAFGLFALLKPRSDAPDAP